VTGHGPEPPAHDHTNASFPAEVQSVFDARAATSRAQLTCLYPCVSVHAVPVATDATFSKCMPWFESCLLSQQVTCSERPRSLNRDETATCNRSATASAKERQMNVWLWSLWMLLSVVALIAVVILIERNKHDD
jgi:hypothetical protein